MLQPMGSQRVGHNWTTELNWTSQSVSILDFYIVTRSIWVPVAQYPHWHFTLANFNSCQYDAHISLWLVCTTLVFDEISHLLGIFGHLMKTFVKCLFKFFSHLSVKLFILFNVFVRKERLTLDQVYLLLIISPMFLKLVITLL